MSTDHFPVEPIDVDPPGGVDATEQWLLHPSVEMRPEPFGALLYHFGTRRLTFLKDRRLADAVGHLAGQPDVAAALRAAGVVDDEQPRFVGALDRLARLDMLVRAGPGIGAT